MSIIQTDFFGDHVSYHRARRKTPGQEGQRRKKAGMRRVLKNTGDDWTCAALNKIREWRASFAKTNKQYAFEDIRAYLLQTGLEKPAHHNAYGALASIAVKEGLIEFTGKYRNATSPATRGHPVRTYRVRVS